MGSEEKMETEQEESTQFCLSKVFSAHKSDVKDLVATNPTSILTASRDGSVKLWTERLGVFKETLSIKQRANLCINSVAFYKSDDGSWLIFAGIRDGSIEVFNSGNSTPIATLANHSQNVCVLFVDNERQLLISGSWDARAVLWSISNVVNGGIEVGQEIVRHKNSVWAVMTMPGDTLLFVTASADRTIKVLNQSFQELHSFTGHTDVVRSLVALSPTDIISAAIDGTLRMWNFASRNCIREYDTMAGRFINKVEKVSHRSGKTFIVCGMKRGFVEIYELTDAGLINGQSLRIPVSSIWSVAGLRGTDILFGASNGNIYVYTTDESRKAESAVLEAMDAEILSLITAEQIAQQSKEDEVISVKVALDDGRPSMTLNYKRGEIAVEIEKTSPCGDLALVRQFYNYLLEGTSDKVIPKLEEMNDLSEMDKKLSREQIDELKQVMSGQEADRELVVSALKTALDWPMETLLPVLDILRVAILNRDIHEIFCSASCGGCQTFDRLIVLLISDPPDNVRILLCRVLANFTAHEPGRRLLMSEIPQIFLVVSSQVFYPKPNVQISAASVLANCARLMLMETESGTVKELGPREDALRAIISAAENFNSFGCINTTEMRLLIRAITSLTGLAKSRGTITDIERMETNDEHVGADAKIGRLLRNPDEPIVADRFDYGTLMRLVGFNRRFICVFVRMEMKYRVDEVWPFDAKVGSTIQDLMKLCVGRLSDVLEEPVKCISMTKKNGMTIPLEAILEEGEEYIAFMDYDSPKVLTLFGYPRLIRVDVFVYCEDIGTFKWNFVLPADSTVKTITSNCMRRIKKLKGVDTNCRKIVAMNERFGKLVIIYEDQKLEGYHSIQLFMRALPPSKSTSDGNQGFYGILIGVFTSAIPVVAGGVTFSAANTFWSNFVSAQFAIATYLLSASTIVLIQQSAKKPDS